jgi:hypothetical protein
MGAFMKNIILGALVSMLLSCGVDKDVRDGDRLEIISIELHDGDLNGEPDLECKGWRMSREDVLLAFDGMREVEPVEWGALCYVYPCSYHGRVRFENKLYEIEINGGAFIKLIEVEGPGVRYFIEEDVTRYFLSPCDCCEDRTEE